MKNRKPKNSQHVVLIVRQPGANPVTGEFMPRDVERLFILAADAQDAHQKAMQRRQMPVMGQTLSMLVNGQYHADERF